MQWSYVFLALTHPLQWRHQSYDCLLNRLFKRRSKKTSKLRVTGLCAGNSPVTGEFPAQRASNAENVSIWWRHYRYVNGKAWHGMHMFEICWCDPKLFHGAARICWCFILNIHLQSHVLNKCYFFTVWFWRSRIFNKEYRAVKPWSISKQDRLTR